MARSYLPPGFRFHPTDEELLVHYLKKKVAGRIVDNSVIGEIDIYKFEPADLPGLAILCSRDPEWFFFNAQDKKYHGSRTNRTTKAGYWKATGKDRKITTRSCTGMKKTLIFYFGRAPHGERTDWVMHEYRLDEEFEKKINCAKSFVLCRVRRKGGMGPRNGEQYGAPVLEPNEADEGDLLTSYSLDEERMLPSEFAKRVGEEEVPEMPNVAISKGRTEIREDIDSFLQTLVSFDEEEQQPVYNGVLSADGLLGPLNSQSEFAVIEPTHAAPTNLFDLDPSSMDNLCALFHPVNYESVMLEEILNLVTGQIEVPDHLIGIKDSLVFQEASHNQASLDMDNLQTVGFLELADLEEPCHEPGPSLPLESTNVEGLTFELENAIGTQLVQETLQLQSLHSFGDRESIRGLQHFEACDMMNEQLALEVSLGSSQGLSVVDSVHSRLLTSDDGDGFSEDLPSGFVLGSDQEGVFADILTSSFVISHSHSSGPYEQSEAELARVNLDVQDGDHSTPSVSQEETMVASVSQEETRVARGEHATINSNIRHSGQPLEGPVSTAGLLNNNSQLSIDAVDSSVVYSAPSPSSPSSLARVISRCLGKVNVLPASAAELPVELERCKPLMKGSSKCLAAKSKTGHSALAHPGSFSMSGSTLLFRVKLNPLLDMEQIARAPEMEHGVPDRGSAKPCKSFTNDLSIFLFWITTSALILFCMFRGFCRATRSAIL